MLVIVESTKMKKTGTPSETFAVDLILEVCENKSITYSVFEPIRLATRKKYWKLKIIF